MRVLKSMYGSYAVHREERVVKIIGHTGRQVIVEPVDEDNPPWRSQYSDDSRFLVAGMDLVEVDKWVSRRPQNWDWHKRKLADIETVTEELKQAGEWY